MKYAFIKSDLVGEFPLPVICRVLRVTQAGYHASLERPASLMAVKRDALADLIRRVFAAFKGKNGAPRIYRELARQHG
ncbi:MAG: transposase, partial [Rhizobacter sp.]|nr:transposase [Burkholderiales bacterium]